MKAKKQKLLFKAIKWIGEQCEMGWNKEEIQDLLDEFIDHHDSKKKSKFKVGDIVVIQDGSRFQNCIAEIIAHDKKDNKQPYHLIILQSEIQDYEGDSYWISGGMNKTNLEKSKFGSDKEQVKMKEEPQEKTIEEWEQEIKEYQKIFIIGKKAKVTSSSATLKHSSNHCFSIGDIVNIDSYEYMGAHCENGTETIDNWVHFKDLEPIKEPSFKVGDMVHVIDQAEDGEVRLYNPISHEWYILMPNLGYTWEHKDNLKLIKNE